MNWDWSVTCVDSQHDYEENALFAEFNNENSAWENMNMTMESIVNDSFQEAHWKQNDIESFEINAISINKDAQIVNAELDVKKSNVNVSFANQLTNIFWKY